MRNLNGLAAYTARFCVIEPVRLLAGSQQTLNALPVKK
jgi:hypothetical protein